MKFPSIALLLALTVSGACADEFAFRFDPPAKLAAIRAIENDGKLTIGLFGEFASANGEHTGRNATFAVIENGKIGKAFSSKEMSWASDQPEHELPHPLARPMKATAVIAKRSGSSLIFHIVGQDTAVSLEFGAGVSPPVEKPVAPEQVPDFSSMTGLNISGNGTIQIVP